MSPRTRKQKSREKLKQKLPSRTLQQAEKLSPRSRKRKSRDNSKQKSAQQSQQANTMTADEPGIEDILEGLQITEQLAERSKELGKRRVAEWRRRSREGVRAEESEEGRLSTENIEGKYHTTLYYYR